MTDSEARSEAFTYRGGSLHAEGVALRDIAQTFGTPCYVYSRAALEGAWTTFDRAFAPHEHLICYAVKANGNLAVLDALARLGAGFDIVSGGELERVRAAGGRMDRTVFAGVGKRREELELALEAGVMCINVESAEELERLGELAAGMGRRAPISLRVNPDIDARTHPYISTGLKQNKFGIPIGEAQALYRHAAARPAFEVVGLDCHIGSQQTTIEPFAAALDRMLALTDALRGDGIGLQHFNAGGGMGIRYRDEVPPRPQDYAAAIGARVASRGLMLIVEPGRAVVGDAGVLLTRVEYRKRNLEREFAVVDCAMNDLLRPALYEAWQEVLCVEQVSAERAPLVDVVGPVCESADFLAKQRRLAVRGGDLLAVRCAGAYAFAMSSNYNARPRAAEVMVDGNRVHLVRLRETVEELFASESKLPEGDRAGNS